MYEQYSTLAKYYDQIYSWKDYQKEAVKIKKLVKRYKHSSGRDLLDVGCGTGKHIQHLSDGFDCVGVDISEQMLDIARRNIHGVELVRSSMTSFRLGRQFDVVLRLFSGMGYLRTRNELKTAFRNFFDHMKAGAVLIIEPWFEKSDWNKGTVHLRTVDTRDLKIARIGYAQSEGGFSVADERYVVAERDRGISYVIDRQKMRFFEPDWTFKTMKDIGLLPRFARERLMPGRRLLVATKPE